MSPSITGTLIPASPVQGYSLSFGVHNRMNAHPVICAGVFPSLALSSSDGVEWEAELPRAPSPLDGCTRCQELSQKLVEVCNR